MKKSFVGFLMLCSSFQLACSAYCQSFSAYAEAHGGFIDTNIRPNTYTNFAVGGLSGFHSDPEFIEADVGDSGSQGLANGEARASASAGEGQVHVEAEALMSSNGGGGSAAGGAEAIADFSDLLQFEGVGRGLDPGDTLLVSSGWKLKGNASGFINFGAPAPGHFPGDPFGTVTGDYSAALDISGTGLPDTLTREAYETESVRYSSLVSFDKRVAEVFIPVLMTVTVGDFFDLHIHLDATAFADIASSDFWTNTGGGASGDSDFGHTLLWGGITSVTDVNGVPIEGWSVTSGSGFDYSQPAVDTPEPSTLVLLGFGGISLAVGSRKKTWKRL